MTDDDQDWLDALAGRAPKSPHRAAFRDGGRLRELILRNVHAPDAAAPAQDAQREAQLLERARREGLIAPAQLAIRAHRRMRSVGFARWVALAAGITSLAVALGFFLRSVTPTTHFRGARENVIHIEAADPTALKMQILDELRAAGVQARGYAQLDVEGIDANLRQPVPPRVRDVLTRHRLSVPGNGELRIEITAPSKP